MTLQEAYDANKGQAILVLGGGAGNNGQCVQWADYVLYYVYNLPYIYTPAAKDWWYNFGEFAQLRDNFDMITDGSIKAGDFVLYDPLSSGDPQGHIDVASRDGVVADFWAYDSNWGGAPFHNGAGYPVLHEVHHNDVFNNKVLGSLRKKGLDTHMPNDGDVDNIYLEFNGRKATDSEKKVYTQKSWSAGDGLYYGKVLPEVENLKKALNDAQNKPAAGYVPAGQLFVKE